MGGGFASWSWFGVGGVVGDFAFEVGLFDVFASGFSVGVVDVLGFGDAVAVDSVVGGLCFVGLFVDFVGCVEGAVVLGSAGFVCLYFFFVVEFGADVGGFLFFGSDDIPVGVDVSEFVSVSPRVGGWVAGLVFGVVDVAFGGAFVGAVAVVPVGMLFVVEGAWFEASYDRFGDGGVVIYFFDWITVARGLRGGGASFSGYVAGLVVGWLLWLVGWFGVVVGGLGPVFVGVGFWVVFGGLVFAFGVDAAVDFRLVCGFGFFVVFYRVIVEDFGGLFVVVAGVCVFGRGLSDCGVVGEDFVYLAEGFGGVAFGCGLFGDSGRVFEGGGFVVVMFDFVVGEIVVCVFGFFGDFNEGGVEGFG